MAPEDIDQVLSQLGAPARDYWENELEISVDAVARTAANGEYLKEWIGKRTGCQVEILRRNLSLNGASSTREKKKDLKQLKRELLPYLLVQEFSYRKSRLATVELAKSVLPVDVLALCKKCEGEFDTLAICFALYAVDPNQLRCILHLDTHHKHGAASMVLKQDRRKPRKTLEAFLQPDVIASILQSVDKSKRDGRTGELMNIMHYDGQSLVFIRRCLRPAFLLRAGEVVHGHEPEWIVLEFFEGAKRVNICSTSVSESLQIANGIASAYYGADCEYQNDSAITYAKQIVRLLGQLRDERIDELVWIELTTNISPFAGENPFTLRDRHFNSIGPSVLDIERKVGPLIEVVDDIDSIKVAYRERRVKLIFEKRDPTKELRDNKLPDWPWWIDGVDEYYHAWRMHG
jgi:hypothetical protein